MGEPDTSGSAAGGAATTGTGRVGNVDVLRAAAALGVLAGHAYGLGGRGLPARAEHWHDVPLLLGTTGVWLFFAISGYVIGKPFVDRLVSGRPLPELVPYALKRTLRIYPLYWVALTAVIVLGVGTGAATRDWQYPVHYALLHNLVPGRQGALIAVAWTLTIEVLFYATVPLLALAVRRWRRAISAERLATLILVSAAVSIAFTAAVDVIGGRGKIDTWLGGSLPAMWQMFCPGLLLAVAPHLRAPRWRRWVLELPGRPTAAPIALAVLTGATALVAASSISWGVELSAFVVNIYRTLFALGFGVVLAVFIQMRPLFQRRARWVLHLGLISYGIYLIHAVVATVLDAKVPELIPMHDDTLPAFFVHLAFLLALTIPLAMASWRWLEQPCIRLAGRLSDAWRASRVPSTPPEVRREPSAVP